MNDSDTTDPKSMTIFSYPFLSNQQHNNRRVALLS